MMSGPASKAFQSGVSLEQILSACHWKSHNTFTQFYLKDVAWADICVLKKKQLSEVYFLWDRTQPSLRILRAGLRKGGKHS